MAEFGEENKGTGVFGGIEFDNSKQENAGAVNGAFGGVQTAENANLPAKPDLWTRFKNFWLQEIDWNKEIKVELTPYQQKVEDEINEFLHQEITWEKVHDFLFQEVSFGRKNK